jgi:hypothetical protein
MSELIYSTNHAKPGDSINEGRTDNFFPDDCGFDAALS